MTDSARVRRVSPCLGSGILLHTLATVPASAGRPQREITNGLSHEMLFADTQHLGAIFREPIKYHDR